MFRQCLGPRQLEEIDRSGEGLQRFPEDVQRHRKRLTTLVLDGNVLREIPQTIGNLAKLEKLSLSGNELETLPRSIAKLGHLRDLILSHNAPLGELPHEVEGCQNLRHLDISATGVQSLPQTITQLVTLTHLIINDSELKRLPPDMSGFSNLLVLEARENMLKFLPVSISNLKKLQRLDLGSNEIEALPRSIDSLASLMELSLDENGLTDLPAELGGFTNLVELDISKNAIVRLPSDFTSLTALTDLYMSENCLAELPESIGKLKNLRLLRVDCNQLTSLPESLSELTKLTELTLSDNSIDTLPNGIGNLKSLTELHADKNQLTSIPYQIGDCENLRMLKLRENQLVEVPRSLGQLKNLKVLDLACNQIQRLPYSVAELELTSLWLCESQVKPLPSLEKDIDTDSGDVFAACSWLPQKPRENDSVLAEEELNRRREHDPNDERHVAFAPDPSKPVHVEPIVGERPNVLNRKSTPYRNELTDLKERARRKHTMEKRASVASRGSVSASPDLPREPAEALFTREAGVSLGISVAGGTGVEQPFRDDDDGVFVTKIKEGGLAEKSGQFQLWDKVLKVNDTSFEGMSHDDAVMFLKDAIGELHFYLSREVHPKTEDKLRVTTTSLAEPRMGDSSASVVIHENTVQSSVGPGAAVPAFTSAAGDEIKDDDGQAQEKHEVEGMEEESKTTMTKEAEEMLGDLDKHLEDSISDSKKEEIVTDTEEAVVLHRVNKSLGMSIVGGNDSSSLPFAAGISADVFISKVVTNGAADRCGRLRMGDRIIEVDGKSLSNESHAFAVKALVDSGDVVKMRVRHQQQPNGMVSIDLPRSNEERLGLSIKGGVDSRPGNPLDADDEGIFVSKIREGSAASRCSQLRVGQRLVEVNGQTLLGATHYDAVALLKDAINPVKLLLCDGYDEALARSVSPADSLRESLQEIRPPALSPPRSDDGNNSELPSPPEVMQGVNGEMSASQDMLPPPPSGMTPDPDTAATNATAAGAGRDDMPAPPPDDADLPVESGEDLPPPPMDDSAGRGDRS